MGKVNWEKEKEDWGRYVAEHTHLLPDKVFRAVWEKMKHGVGNAETVAITLAHSDGSKDFLFNWDEIKKDAGEFAPRLLEYLYLHEATESWLVFKRGFNLRKETLEKWKKEGGKGRPLAHLLALREEYQTALERGDLEQLHNWWREWMGERIREMEEKGDAKDAETQRENLKYREDTYTQVSERKERRAA